MTKQILLPASVLREMREKFKVGRNDLRRALNYERNSDRARMLRAAALERGGLIYTGERAPKGYCPSVETRHDQVRGMMYQTFGGRVELQVSRETNANNHHRQRTRCNFQRHDTRHVGRCPLFSAKNIQSVKCLIM